MSSENKSSIGKRQVGDLATLLRRPLLPAFPGVGLLHTNFREMSKQGLLPFSVGALSEVSIAILTLGLVIGANAIWHL